MADVGTPSAIDISTSNVTPEVEKQHKAKPEKPDEDRYKTDLSKAEKEHAAAQEKLVCLLPGPACSQSHPTSTRLDIFPSFLLNYIPQLYTSIIRSILIYISS